MTPANDDQAHRFLATVADVERAGAADDPLIWYAAQCNPNCETKARDNLIDAGFTVYLPMETKWHRATRRGKAEAQRKPKSRPLMVGYLFFGKCRMQSFYAARNADGIRSLVGALGKPCMVPVRLIERLKDREDRGYFDETRPITGRHKAGDRVTVTEGVFAGQLGEVLESIADGKLRVEIAGLFGVGAPVDVDDDHVEARVAA